MQPIRSWNQEKVDALFSSMSGGIRPASPFEVIALFLGVVFLLLLLIRLEKVRRRRGRERLAEQSRQNFSAIAQERKLSASEKDLLAGVASFTPDPEVSYGLVARDEQAFYLALRLYLDRLSPEERMARTPLFARLIYRLEFGPRKEGLEAFTTADLPPGTAFYQAGEKIGRLKSQTAEYFTLQSDAPAAREAAIHRREGRYTLQLMPLGDHRYQHTILERSVQRRSAVRFPLKLTATYNRQRVEIQNISAGGALISGSGHPLQGHLSFSLDKSVYDLDVRVVAESNHGTHLQFQEAETVITDRLFRTLLKGES